MFAERWTPLIIRNLHLGYETFGAISEGAAGLSRTVLAQRLEQLERLGIVESAPNSQARGHRYRPTDSGHDLFKVCQTLGEWGARWLELAPGGGGSGISAAGIIAIDGRTWFTGR